MMEKEWSRQDKILDSIRDDIRGKLPLTAMSDTETIHIPQVNNWSSRHWMIEVYEIRLGYGAHHT